jgi:hypothetical protein
LILTQLAQTLTFVQHHFARSLFQIAPQNLHKSGLAATIGTDQAVAVTVSEFDRDVFKQGLAPNCMVIFAVESMMLPKKLRRAFYH